MPDRLNSLCKEDKRTGKCRGLIRAGGRDWRLLMSRRGVEICGDNGRPRVLMVKGKTCRCERQEQVGFCCNDFVDSFELVEGG